MQSQRMANCKAPKYVEFVAELPKSAIGKILRKDLREADIRKTAGNSPDPGEADESSDTHCKANFQHLDRFTCDKTKMQRNQA